MGMNLLKTIVTITLTLVLSVFFTEVHAQELDKVKITIDVEDFSVKQILDKVESDYGVRFFYNERNLNVVGLKSLKLKKVSFDSFIEALFDGRAEYTVSTGGIVSLRLKEVVGQEVGSVYGTVRDAEGEPLAGVYVLIKGAVAGGTFTDIDGKYRINAKRDDMLAFSLMGMKNLVFPVNGKSCIDVTMVEDIEVLDDLIVTALGVKKYRKALGFSVTEMKSEEFLKNKNVNIVNSLVGRVAGVNVTLTGGAAGAGSSIIIRGGNSVSEGRNNQPLFVVDGVIYDNSTINGGGSGTDGITASVTTFSNRVMDMNPEDVENISILKGAAAAALYGSRAADGVVVITTKKGSSDGSIKLNFSSKFSYSEVCSVPDIQSKYCRGEFNEAGLLLTDNVTSSWGNINEGPIYDNIGEFYRGGTSWDNNFSLAGGHKNGNFYFSASRFDQEGVIPETGYEKSTLRLNGEQRYGNLELDINVAYSVAKTKKTLTTSGLYNGGGNGIMTALYGWSRSENMSKWLNDDGTKYLMFPHLPLESQVENPYWIVNMDDMTERNERITGSATLSYKFAEWVDLSFRMGVDSYINEARTYIAPGASAKKIYQNGRLSISDTKYNYINTNLMLNLFKVWGDFEVSGILGFSTDDSKYKSQAHWGYNFQVPGTVSFDNIILEEKFFDHSVNNKRLVGVYGEARASWKNMLYLTVTGRNDWTSTLPVENRSYFYPSVSASFVFTELFKGSSLLSFGKIRGSWAEVGKDSEPYTTNTYMWDSEKVNGNYVGIGNKWNAGHKYLKPERQRAWEIGAELKFFNGRLALDYTYYQSETYNQIASPRLSQATGYILFAMNSGSVRNKGMELMVSGVPVERKDFYWDVALNMSGNRGTLGNFVDGIDYFYVTDVQIGAIKAASIPNAGYFLGMTGDIWLKEKDEHNKEIPGGKYLVDPHTGLYKLSGTENNVVGNREPKLIGGLTNTFRYKDLTLSFLFDFRIGGDIYNGTQYYLTSEGQSELTLDRNMVNVSGINAITGEPFDQTYRRGEYYMVGGILKSGEYMIQQYWNNYCMNSHSFIQDVNWLKLRYLNLSYSFNDLIRRQNFIKDIAVNVSANNIFTLTNYNGGMDPEVAAVSSAGGSGSVGIDYCGVPSQRTYTFGINLVF